MLFGNIDDSALICSSMNFGRFAFLENTRAFSLFLPLPSASEFTALVEGCHRFIGGARLDLHVVGTVVFAPWAGG
jgi:hypothetical protein